MLSVPLDEEVSGLEVLGCGQFIITGFLDKFLRFISFPLEMLNLLFHLLNLQQLEVWFIEIKILPFYLNRFTSIKVGMVYIFHVASANFLSSLNFMICGCFKGVFERIVFQVLFGAHDRHRVGELEIFKEFTFNCLCS
jgi:hypothetical protein